MSAGRHLEKRKIAIYQLLFQISSRNLVCCWTLAGRTVPLCHFWTTTKSKMAAGAILKKNGKSQNFDSHLRCLHKFFSQTANIIYKKLQAFYLMLYKRYKTAKIKKYKHEHYALA